MHMRSFVKIKSSRHGEIPLLFTDIFNVANMSLKLFAKIKFSKFSEFTVKQANHRRIQKISSKGVLTKLFVVLLLFFVVVFFVCYLVIVVVYRGLYEPHSRSNWTQRIRTSISKETYGHL